MLHRFLAYPLGNTGLLLEALLPIYILVKRQLRNLKWVAAYGAVLAAADALRAGVVYAFGISSVRYAYAYWVTDFAGTLAAFLLTWTLFYRACANNLKLWKQIRFLLATSLLLVAAISALIFLHYYHVLFTRFVIEFNQNLYFTILVLVTLLYLMLMQIKSEDEQLILLVSGLGIEFAGPAASLAFEHLAGNVKLHDTIAGAIIPVCNLAMLGVWYYAVGHPSKAPALNPAAAHDLLTAEKATGLKAKQKAMQEG